MVTIDFNLADMKLESSEAYLLKLGENLSWDFKVIYLFCTKNADISNVFIPQENKEHFLKARLFFIKDAIEIGLIFPAEKGDLNK